MDENLNFLAQDAQATAAEGHLILTFRIDTPGQEGKEVAVQIANSTADKLLVSLGAALAKSHATDAAEMVKRFTAGLTTRR